jgi:DNA-binding CsgD family transcriptional regulator
MVMSKPSLAILRRRRAERADADARYRRELLACIDAGLPQRQIAAAIGCTISYVSKLKGKAERARSANR